MKRHRLAGVERRSRGKNQLFAVTLLHQLEDVESTLGIRLHVNVRILDAVANSGAGGEIENDIEGVCLGQAINLQSGFKVWPFFRGFRKKRLDATVLG